MLNKTTAEQLNAAVTALRANGFDNLREAAIYCAVVTATVDGGSVGVTEISRLVKQPITTVSRIVTQLSARGFVESRTHAGDARVKLVTANLNVFKLLQQETGG